MKRVNILLLFLSACTAQYILQNYHARTDTTCAGKILTISALQTVNGQNCVPAGCITTPTASPYTTTCGPIPGGKWAVVSVYANPTCTPPIFLESLNSLDTCIANGPNYNTSSMYHCNGATFSGTSYTDGACTVGAVNNNPTGCVVAAPFSSNFACTADSAIVMVPMAAILMLLTVLNQDF